MLTQKHKTNGSGMVLTERDVRLIHLVAEHRVLTRDQIRRFMGFGSITRINAVLLRLVTHTYLTRRWQPTLTGSRRAVYLLGSLGYEVLNGPGTKPPRQSPWLAHSDLFVEHELAINDVRLSFDSAHREGLSLLRWMRDRELRCLKWPVVADAYAEWVLGQASFAAFVEVDLGTESLTIWHKKVQGYLALTRDDRFSSVFGRRFFRVLVVAPSARRLANIKSVIQQYTDRVFWLTTRAALVRHGALRPIWKRPTGRSLLSLTTL
jgi:hypothetical protein